VLMLPLVLMPTSRPFSQRNKNLFALALALVLASLVKTRL